MHRRTFLAATVALPAALAAPVRKAKADLSLILIENVPEQGVVTKRRLVRVRVTDGTVGKPEEVVAADQRFFAHFTQHRLHADRYLLTGDGGVVDLPAGKIIHDEQGGDLLGVDGDRVIFKVDRTGRESGVFAFDLTTKKVAKLADPGRWALPGVVSPDGKRSVDAGMSDELTLHTVGEKPGSLGKGFVVHYSHLSSYRGCPPVLWLDADRLLTQTGNGRLVTVTADDGERADAATVDASTELVAQPRLRRDGLGDVVYECGKQAFKIDLKTGKGEAYDWCRHPHGFDVSHAADPTTGYTFRHNGAEVGSGFGAAWRPETADGHLAYVGWAKPEFGAHFAGTDEEVRIWSAVTQKWTALRMWPESLVGWVKN